MANGDDISVAEPGVMNLEEFRAAARSQAEITRPKHPSRMTEKEQKSSMVMNLSEFRDFARITVRLEDLQVGASDEQRAKWAEMGEIGFWEGAARNGDNAVPFIPVGGIKAAGVVLAARRLEANEYNNDIRAFEDDVKTLNEYLFQVEEERVRGFSGMGQFGSAMVQVPAVLVEFGLTAGVAAVGKKAAVKGATFTLKKILREKLSGQVLKGLKGRFLGRAVKTTVGALGGAAARTATGFLPRAFGEAAEIQLESRVRLTKKGLAIGEARNKPYQSLMKGLGSVFISAFVEDPTGPVAKALGITGRGLTKGGKFVAGKIPASTKFKETMVAAISKLYQKIRPGKSLSELQTAVGWNGFWGELGEEQVEKFFGAITGVQDFSALGVNNPNDTIFDRLHRAMPSSWTEVLVEAGVIFTTGAGLRLTNNIAQRRRDAKQKDPELKVPTDAEILQVIVAEKKPPGLVDTKLAVFSDELLKQIDAGEIKQELDDKGEFVFKDKEGKTVPVRVQDNVFVLAKETAPTFEKQPAAEEKAPPRVPEPAPEAVKVELTAEEKSLQRQRDQIATQKAVLLKRFVALEGKKQTPKVEKDLNNLSNQIRALDQREVEIGKSLEEVVVARGRTERLSEEGETIQTKIDTLEKQRQVEVDKSEARTEKLDAELGDLLTQQTKLEKKRAKAKAKFKSTVGIDRDLARLKTKAKTLDQQNAKRIAESETTVKSIDKQIDTLFRQFDVVSEQIDQLTKGLAPTVKARQKITQTAQQAVSALKKSKAQGIAVTKKSIRDAQDKLIKVIEDSGLSREDRSKFIRTVKSVQSVEQLSRAFPKISERIENLRDRSTRKRLIASITKLLKRSTPKTKRGLPKGRFTPTAQTTLDNFRKATKMIRQEAALHVEDMFVKLSKENEKRKRRGEDEKTPLDDDFLLEQRIFENASDLTTRSAKDLKAINDRVTFIMEQARTQREAIDARKKAETEQAIEDFIISALGKTPEGNLFLLQNRIESGKASLTAAKVELSSILKATELSEKEKTSFQESIDSLQKREELVEEDQSPEDLQEAIDKEFKKTLRVLQMIRNEVPTLATKEKSGLEIANLIQTFGFTQDNWEGIMSALSKAFVPDVPFKNVLDIETPLTKQTHIFNEIQDEKVDTMNDRNAIVELEKDAYGVTNQVDLMRERIKASQQIKVGNVFDAKGNKILLTISKDEIIELWKMLQNPQTRIEIEAEEGGIKIGDKLFDGVPSELSERLFNRYLTPEDIVFAQAQLEFSDTDLYPKFNAKFEERQGVSLMKVENHTHLKRFLKKKKIADSILEEAGHRANTVPSAGRVRVKNFQKLIVRPSRQTIDETIIEVNHFVNLADKVDKLASIFEDGRVRNIIEQRFGEAVNKIIVFHIGTFQTGRKKDPEIFESKLRAWRGRFAVSAIGIKPTIMLKQLISSMAAIEFGGVRNFVAGTVDFAINFKEAIAFMQRSREMSTRNLGNMSLDLGAFQDSRARKRFITNPTLGAYMEMATDVFTAGVRFGDRLGAFIGGWAVIRNARKEGKTEAEQLVALDRYVTSTQQSRDPDQLSATQKGGPLWETMSMFMTAQAQYYRRITNAVRNVIAGKITKKQFAETILVYNVLLPGLFQMVSDLFPWSDDDEEENRMLRAMILGPAEGLVVVRNIVKWLGPKITNSLTGAKEREFRLDQSIKILDSLKGIGDAIDELDFTDIQLEDFLDATGDLLKGTVGPVTGIPIKAAFDEFEGIQDMIRGDLKPGTLKLLGWTPSVVEKRLGIKKKREPKKKKKIDPFSQGEVDPFELDSKDPFDVEFEDPFE